MDYQNQNQDQSQNQNQNGSYQRTSSYNSRYSRGGRGGYNRPWSNRLPPTYVSQVRKDAVHAALVEAGGRDSSLFPRLITALETVNSKLNADFHTPYLFDSVARMVSKYIEENQNVATGASNEYDIIDDAILSALRSVGAQPSSDTV